MKIEVVQICVFVIGQLWRKSLEDNVNFILRTGSKLDDGVNRSRSADSEELKLELDCFTKLVDVAETRSFALESIQAAVSCC
jgi:hypothetical protein